MPEDSPQGEDARPLTLLERLVRAGIEEERARTWIHSGGARVDGEPVIDVDCPAEPPRRVVLYPA
ncbi:hypothetical protein ACFPK1_27580 [Actinomycetospora rhizophila]|uniref:RNA-binding S4 domain-containing protein n=1 Tax=Actinomycetospora rhizophila TaxID=1416876 RepID=A0ABV9ZKK4_9PSEU